MKRIIILMQLILIGLVAIGQELKVAPINPKYLEYLENKESIKQANAKASAYPLGEIPTTVVPSFKNFKSPLKTKANLPSSYDLRLIENGKYVTPAKDQGAEGACWSFATYGALESYCKKIGLEEYDFSEQNMVVCHEFDNEPGQGGHYLMSIAYLARKSGPVLEEEDPYTLPEDNPKCKEGITPAAYVGDLRIIPGKFEEEFDMDLVKQSIIDYGALYMNFYYSDWYMNYSDNTFYYDGTDAPNHGVTLVGWDDNKVVTGGPRATPSSPGAWIVKNSWGPDWSTEEGYFYISYEDNMALNNVGYFPSFIENKENLVIQFYDKLGWTGSAGFEEGSHGLVKFTAENDLMLKKIGTYVTKVNMKISIDVYETLLGNQLLGHLGSVSNIDCQLPGYYTFDLPTPVTISKGRDYFIKVSYRSDSIYIIPTEVKVPGHSSKAEIQTGKCWISPTGAQWQAVGKGTNYEFNLCIKAYTESIVRRYVTQDGTGDGSSWDNASNDLQAMINELKGIESEIWVAEGTYTPKRPADNLDVVDVHNKNNAFVLAKDVKLYGGFKGDETSLSGRTQLDSLNNKYSTVLSGLLSATDTAYHVVISIGDMGDALLDRFTIAEGNATGDGSITIEDIEIAQNAGGGMYIVNSSPTLANLTISNNSASLGGGFFNDASEIQLKNVSITNNSAVNGGGIYSENKSNITLINSFVRDNIAEEKGGGIFDIGGGYVTTSGVYVNTLFADNNTTGKGGVLFYENGENSQPIFINCTFSNNTANLGNVVFYSKNGNGNAPKFHNCIIDMGEDATGELASGDVNYTGINDIIFKYTLTSYSTLGNHSENTENIVNTDPLFINVANNDFHLQSDSPALWKGDVTVFNSTAIPNISTETKDPDGNQRIRVGRIDMGMYQNLYDYVSITEIEKSVILGVYPNPTKGIINIDTENNLSLEIKVYSIKGELLLKEKGNRIDISNFASGIYIMQIGNQKIKIIKE